MAVMEERVAALEARQAEQGAMLVGIRESVDLLRSDMNRRFEDVDRRQYTVRGRPGGRQCQTENGEGGASRTAHHSESGQLARARGIAVLERSHSPES